MDIKGRITRCVGVLSGGESWKGVGVFGGGIDGINVGSELVGMFEVCIGDTGLEIDLAAGGGVEGGSVVGGGGVQAGSVVMSGSWLVRVLGEVGDGSGALVGSASGVVRGGVLRLFLVQGEYPWGV